MPPISISIDAPSAAEVAALAALSASLSGAAPASPSAPPSAPAVNYFPADPGTAPFPSPENSITQVLNGVISGAPYLRDADGVIWQLTTQLTTTALGHLTYEAAGTNYYITNNGVLVWSGVQMIVRQGMVYITSALRHTFTAIGNGNFQQVPIPPAFTTPSAPVQLPPMPADPTPAAVAPGSSGTVILAGPSQTIKTLTDAVAAAKPGDTIRLDAGAVFNETVAFSAPVVLDGQGGVNGQGGAIIDGSTITAYAKGGNGLLVALTDCVFTGLEVRGVGLKETQAGGTAGIRASAACYVSVKNCYIHDCQDGLFSGGFGCVWSVYDTLLESCGLGDGMTHNAYFGPSVVRVSLSNVTSTTPKNGHALKTRAATFSITGGAFDADAATVIDIPDGTTQPFSITGATITKPASSAMHGVIGYGVESTTNGLAGGTISGGTIDAECANPFIQTLGGTITLSGVTLKGNKIVASGGGVVVGLPA